MKIKPHVLVNDLRLVMAYEWRPPIEHTPFQSSAHAPHCSSELVVLCTPPTAAKRKGLQKVVSIACACPPLQHYFRAPRVARTQAVVKGVEEAGPVPRLLDDRPPHRDDATTSTVSTVSTLPRAVAVVPCKLKGTKGTYRRAACVHAPRG